MTNIEYVKGDATRPLGDNTKMVLHCCNDIGKWGAGFVLALNNRWMEPKREYVNWFGHGKQIDSTISNTTGSFKLGEVQTVTVESDIVIANMIGQKGVRYQGRTPPIRYSAIDSCLKKVADIVENQAKVNNVITIHCPRFGSGLAGGKWPHIESLIIENICSKGIPVTVYDL